MAGYSWSAITALTLAYSHGEGQRLDEIAVDELGTAVAVPRAGTRCRSRPHLVEFSGDPDAVISHAGFALAETIDRGEPPALLVHGTNDRVVPFSLAEHTCAAAAAVDVVCELVSHDNGHGFSGMHDPADGADPTVQSTIDFLNREVLAPAGISLLR